LYFYIHILGLDLYILQVGEYISNVVLYYTQLKLYAWQHANKLVSLVSGTISSKVDL